jgi:hypothetical protein
MIHVSIKVKNTSILKNPDYRSDNKMAYRPIGRLMHSTNHQHCKINNKSVASLKTALPKDIEGHSQKLLLSLVPIAVTPRHGSFSQHQLSEQGQNHQTH